MPKLRIVDGINLRARVYDTVEKEFTRSIKDHPFKSCLNCIYFKEDNEECVLANARPPAKIIVFGCPKHEDITDIPF